MKKQELPKKEIAEHYEQRNFSKAILAIRELADEVNKYMDETKPWKLVKEDTETTHKILTASLNVFRLLAIYLKPVLPEYSDKVAGLFNEEAYTWQSLEKTLENHQLEEFSHLVQRLDTKMTDAIIEASKT